MSKSANAKFPETDNAEVAQRVEGKVTTGALRKVSLRVDGKDSVSADNEVLEGVRKFRQANPRIDFYPTQEAMAAIASLHQQFPAASLREVIDTLILEGIKAFPEK